MNEIESYPPPVAFFLRRFARTPATDPERIITGADLGYAVVKYVALVRLADWLHAGRPEPDWSTIDAMDHVLGGASSRHWWDVGRLLDHTFSAARVPTTPGWSTLQRAAETLGTARLSRHAGIRQGDDPALSASVEDAVDQLMSAAAPLLALPLVRSVGATREPLRGVELADPTHGSWTLGVMASGELLELDPFWLTAGPKEPGAEQDLLVYEKLTGHRAVVYERGDTLVEKEQRAPTLEELLRWVAEQRDLDAMRKLDPAGALGGAAGLRRALVATAEAALGHERHLTPTAHVERPEVEEVWTRWAGTAQRRSALALVGQSGLGKTRECVHWLQGEMERGAVPLWIRAATWGGESLDRILGRALTGRALPLGLERLAEAAEGAPVAVVVDGLNEADDPDELLRVVVSGLALLGHTRLLVGCRPERFQEAWRGVPATWRVSLPGALDGALRLEPLTFDASRELWRQAEALHAPRFDQLPAATRQLVRVPIMCALAMREGVFDVEIRHSADGIIERFVAVQTTEIERLLMRHLAERLLAAGRADLDAAAIDDDEAKVIRRALTGEPQLAAALERLLDVGILRRSGGGGATQEMSIAFAHDRMTQWLAGRVVADHARGAGTGGTPPDMAYWSELHARHQDTTALAAAVGQGLAAVDEGGHVTLALLASEHERERALGRMAAIAVSDLRPERARSWLSGAAWRTRRRRRRVRAELLEVAAETGHADVLAASLRYAPLRGDAQGVLSRIRRFAPETVQSALEAAWKEIGRHPWWSWRQTLALAHALVLVQFAEGALVRPHPPFAAMAREVARRLLGVRLSFGKRLLLRAVAPLVALTVRIASGGLIGVPDPLRELPRWFRLPRSERRRFAPLVDLYAGRTRPSEVAGLLEEVALGRDFAAGLLLERSLIMAALRPETAAEALDLALELGTAARRLSPPTMTGQSVMYIYEVYLTRRPTAHDWGQRFDTFDALCRDWLVAAPDRRWQAASGARYKSLFATAHALLWYQRHGAAGSPFVRELWDRAITGQDEALALDLLNDLQILGITRARHALALLEMEPLSSSDGLSTRVEIQAAKLLASFKARDPELVERALHGGPGLLRARLAARVATMKPKESAAMALFLNFDDALVISESLNETVAEVLAYGLEAPSMRAWIRRAVELMVARLVSESPAPEAEK